MGSARSMASTFESSSSDDDSNSNYYNDDGEEKSDMSPGLETNSFVGSTATDNISTGVAVGFTNLHVEVEDFDRKPSDTLPVLKNRTNFGLDGDFAPRRWPIMNQDKASVFQSPGIDTTRALSGAEIFQSSSSSMMNHIPGKSITSTFHSAMGDVEVIASPLNKLNEIQVIIPESNSLAIPIRSGAGRKQVLSESYSYGPDSLRAGRVPGRVGRPLFQQEAEETEEERRLRLLKKSNEERSLAQESVSSMISSLTCEDEHDKVELEERARLQVSQYHEVEHLAPHRQELKLREIQAQSTFRAQSEAERAMLMIQQVLRYV